MKDASPVRVVLTRSRAIDPGVNKVARALTQSGFTVDLLVWGREGRAEANDRDTGYRVHRFNLKAPYYKATLLFFLPIWWFYELFFLLRSRVDVIHACDLDTLLPAIIAKALKRTRLCYTIFDFYADTLPQKVPGFIRQWTATIEKFGISFTDVLFLVDDTRYEQVREAKINRLEYINNSPEDCIDLNATAKLECTSEVNVFYAGYLDKSRGLEEMITAVSQLDGTSLTIAGAGPAREIIDRNTVETDNVQYMGWISYEEVIRRTLAADILFALYDPEIPSNKYASPNKLFEAMMCARPIIVNEGVTASKIVIEEKCGLTVPYGDIEAIKAAIIKLKNDVSLRRALGDNGRQAYVSRYSWEIMRNRLINAYQKLAKPA